MTVIEERPELRLDSGYEPKLCVERDAITFQDLPGDRVLIRVTVHNLGAQGSQPTSIRLESAPLGAFVPWRPLARVPVPALEPGESRELSTEAARSRPAPLGDFDRVPPKRLLTALSAPDESVPEPGKRLGGLLSLFGRGRAPRPTPRDLKKTPTVAPDLMDLVNRGQPHWAGNINVFVGEKAVERHLARALRIYPGRNNLAMFVVGSVGQPDAYAFELLGLAPEWDASLFDASNGSSLAVNSSDIPLEEQEWVQSDGGLLMMLSVRPPAGCHAGRLEVHVTRRSSGKAAIVEFDLDPLAQGSGCYFV